ncbi:histidinol dehydrogenase [Hymenobacter sp. BT186]|uniref:Histidinol dehydrogenase n=1 Tax=Hymenobacter telluris TaxID=2816474 RepID=A0A939EWL3_9BACT|nr:histidinol dehydrogenase [Hymenobacter telluris]MBO0358532.1 histidinol dehydrogenase [Hymenobacter telluris]MBW3374558.1 histidinol dehydrogenase [Hymenobacter norwichensis]
MQLIQYPAQQQWAALQQRAAAQQAQDVEQRVQQIFEAVRQRGDAALLEYAQRFDGADLASGLRVSPEELAAAVTQVPSELQTAIRQAHANIWKFHATQREEEKQVETMPGVSCWRRAVPVQRVGLYIPGGTAPLFSTLLMLGVPARLAGCPEVVLCTPPQPDGSVNPVILFTAHLLGIDTIIKAGGAQAIAALSGGTESVPGVDKIFGPGNRYVTAAKQLATRYGVAIDMPAGPSEVLVIADESANPVFVAADLLSQAEHGPDSQVILLSDSLTVLEQTQAEVQRQLAALPRAAVATQALTESRAILLRTPEEMLYFSNQYAPEHLILAVRNPEELAEGVTSAGSVFLGHLTPEAAGDYASGTNHTLPTNGYARNYSGVSLDSFFKKITFQRITAEGLLHVGPVVEIMAEAEGLQAHARAVTLRLDAIHSASSTPTASARPAAHS